MNVTNDKLKEIETLTTGLLRAAIFPEDIIPPVKLDRVLDKNGVKIKTGNFQDPTILGAFDKSVKTIYLPESEPTIESSFTVAHELGHLFLHEHKEKDIFYRKDALNISKEEREQEQEANYFAVYLLMPSDWIELVWNTEKNTEILATRFGVSSLVAHWRLLTAGLIKE